MSKDLFRLSEGFHTGITALSFQDTGAVMPLDAPLQPAAAPAPAVAPTLKNQFTPS